MKNMLIAVYRNALTAFLGVYRNALTAFLGVYRNALTAFLGVYRNALTAFLGTSAVALVVCLAVAATPTVAAPQALAQTAPVASTTEGLSDLNAMTFACPKAGLNAAARQAAKVPSQGTYQFSYFKMINEGHHSAYEVHFKSNYEGEPDLRYCVEMYCQQGWDPNTTKPTLTMMSTQRAGVKTHGAACGAHQAPAARDTK